LRCGCWLKQSKHPHGYKFVCLYDKKGSHIQFLVHRLVGIAFIENPLKLPEINHIDGNKENNNSLNLEWVTPKQNKRHAWKIGLSRTTDSMIEARKRTGSKTGRMNGIKTRRLSMKEIQNIRLIYALGGVKQVDLANQYGVSQHCISKIVRGKSYSV
jgi:hypothetical protein